MKCFICKHGQTKPGLSTVTLERSGVTLLIRNVPTEICDECGERYYSEATTRAMRLELEAAEKVGKDLQVRSYAA